MPAAPQMHASSTDSDRFSSTSPPRPAVPSQAKLSPNLPSNAALFVKNLRFLDLDLLPDWPDITVNTFRPTREARVTQRDRVRSAEWVLYNLFALWEPNEAKTRLLPFFPALEPLQSIKLRAALYQSLNQLKTVGILGRDCAVRKSMLDDCQGERFEELLFAFSSAVLRKTVSERKLPNGHITPLQQSAMIDKLNWIDMEHLEPLLWTHQKFLTNSLQKRSVARQRLQGLEEALVAKSADMDTRRQTAELRLTLYQRELNRRNTAAHGMKKQLRDRCTGDQEWLSVLISGDPEQSRDPLLEDSFDNVWTKASIGAPIAYPVPSSKSLLATLDKTVTAQQARLASMRLFQTQLSQRNEALLLATSPRKSPLKSPRKSPRKPSPTSPPKRPLLAPTPTRLKPPQPRATTEDVIGLAATTGDTSASPTTSTQSGETAQTTREEVPHFPERHARTKSADATAAARTDVFRTRDKLRMSPPRDPIDA